MFVLFFKCILIKRLLLLCKTKMTPFEEIVSGNPVVKYTALDGRGQCEPVEIEQLRVS